MVISRYRTFFLKRATANISIVQKRQVRSMNEYADIGFFGTDVRRPPECGSGWRANERVAANRNESSVNVKCGTSMLIYSLGGEVWWSLKADTQNEKWNGSNNTVFFSEAMWKSLEAVFTGKRRKLRCLGRVTRADRVSSVAVSTVCYRLVSWGDRFVERGKNVGRISSFRSLRCISSETDVHIKR